MWTLLNSNAAWVAHKKDVIRQLGVTPPMGVAWGTDPTSYPCLVCSLAPAQSATAPQRIYSAFVYVEDVTKLLVAANKKTVDIDQPLPPNQDQFNRWVSAYLFALTSFMVETGLCAPKGGERANEEAFEIKLAEMLEKIDGYRNDKTSQQGFNDSQLKAVDMLGDKQV